MSATAASRSLPASSVDAFWEEPDLDGAAIVWARSTWDAFAPFSTGGVYANFSGFRDEAYDVRPAVQGASAARLDLDQIRAEYDPDGIFATVAKVP